MPNISQLLLALLCLSAALGVQSQAAAKPALTVPPPATPAPLPTLTQDLEEIYRLIQFQPINQLVERYLLNDAQFQAVVRIINSQQAFVLRLRWRSQPEVIAFNNWLNAQLLLSGGPLELEESEQTWSLLNRLPYWPTTVSGWQGFMNELQLYYPEHVIKAHIQTKILQPGIFKQFWERVRALQPVYQRWLALPEAQALIANLNAAGVDTLALDQFIRAQFDWQQVAAAATSTTTAATPISSSSSSSTVAAPIEPLAVA